MDSEFVTYFFQFPARKSHLRECQTRISACDPLWSIAGRPRPYVCRPCRLGLMALLSLFQEAHPLSVQPEGFIFHQYERIFYGKPQLSARTRSVHTQSDASQNSVLAIESKR